ncbi:MAG TPA: VCBS repeat-containing protein, partial [Bryobacteraceae bacterium]
MQNANCKSTLREAAARTAQINLKPGFSIPPLIAALFALACNLSPASAQLASCQTPAPPFKIPSFADANIGFPLNSSTMASPHNQFVTGDIDGDGNDELVTILNGEVRIWRWLSSGGWTSVGKISSSDISAFFPDNFYPVGVSVNTIPGTASTDTMVFGPTSVRIADVDGDGQNEIAIYVEHGDDNLIYDITSGKLSLQIHTHDDLELIYKYDKTASTFKLLTSYPASYTVQGAGFSSNSYALGPSFWVKAHKTDTSYTRVRFNSYTGNIDAAQFVNGAWTAVPAAALPTDLNPGTCVHTGGSCVAYTDLNGDGNTDMVYLANDGTTHILPSTAQKLFGGTLITSKIPAVPTAGSPSQVTTATTLGWMMGDIDGDGKDELVFPTNTALTAYYWDAGTNDFRPVNDPGLSLANAVKNQVIDFGSMTIAPNPIQLPNNGLQSARGVVAVGSNATVLLAFSNQGGQTTTVQSGFGLQLDNTISVSAGLGSTYAQFLRLPVEGNGLVLLTRSSSGLINHVPTPRPYETGNFFVEPSTVPEVSDRGYPVYTASQLLAYQYISTATVGNADIRSLYPDPAVPWAHFQYRLETLAAPPASAGISPADFALVQERTDDELTALQSTNAFFGVTGQILTNTYLVKDAALSETTGLLGLPSQPDVTGQVLNDVTTALNGLGSVLSAAGSIVQI